MEYYKLQGYAMYCEVSPEVLPHVKQYLEEGKVLYIWKACVERAKPGYRVVDAPYMLKLIMRTEIFEGNSNDTSFPKYVFSLTPIEILPQYARRTDRFLGKKNISLHIISCLPFDLHISIKYTSNLCHMFRYHDLQSFLNVDVIGKITAISNAAVARNTSGDLMMRRLITLQDHK